MKTILTIMAACCMLCGCKVMDNPISYMNTSAVVVGMRHSQAFGECPGCDIDVLTFKKIVKDYAHNVKVLENGSANYSAVSKAFKDACKSDLAIIFYSGHGGQQRFSDTHDEADNKDEFLCLNDRYMRDDDIWEIISHAKGRVMLIFDCCHSGTMYKSFSFNKFSDSAMALSNGSGILCWSGCPDNTYSYGGEGGGEFTNAIKRNFKKSMSYDELWNAIAADPLLKKFETVQRTQIGPGFNGKKVFE